MWDYIDCLNDWLSGWQQWVQQPQRLWLYNAVFQLHFWVGAIVGAWITLMSITGSVLVFYNDLPPVRAVVVLAHLHANLLSGPPGRLVNGIGAIALTLLCLTGAVIWWPGVKNWRRSLRVEWSARFPRISWDLHSATGFWFFVFVLLWGISGIYFVFPQIFNALFGDPILFRLSQLHFGRFNRFTEIVWAVAGLAPAALAFTGTFICCRRVLYRKPSNPYR